MWQVWVLPLLVYGVAFALAIPIGLYMARVFDGRLHTPRWLRWIESRLDTGPQNWKQYAFAFMAFNVVTFLVGFAVLTLQPYLPLNPDGKKMLAPTTIFNTVCSFLTNTNLQHYSGEVHLSYFSQLFFICWKQVLSPMIGMAALVAIIRGLRGDKHMGNFYRRSVARDGIRLCAALPHCRSAAHGQRRAHDAGWTCGRNHAGAGGDGGRQQWSTDIGPADCPRPGRGHRCGQAIRHQRRRLLRCQ